MSLPSQRLTINSVRESGKLDQQSKGHTAEGADDPLTLADTSSHKEMVQSLKQAWPKLHVVSEEVGPMSMCTHMASPSPAY
jgi:fructose-1,6-bisphosphatase/inositol monophosphatase family enzyme